MAYPYVYGDYDRDERGGFESLVEKEAEALNLIEGRTINIYLYSQNGLRESFTGDL